MSTIIQNGDAGFSTVDGTGAYGVWDSASGGYDGIDYLYHDPGDGTAKATWDLGVLSGIYEIEVHWTQNTNRATDAPYTIKNHSGVDTLPSTDWVVVAVADNVDEDGNADNNSTTIDIDQENSNTGSYDGAGVNSGFKIIGRYAFQSSDDGKVILTSDANDHVIADAIRITEITTGTVEVLGGVTSVSGGITSITY